MASLDQTQSNINDHASTDGKILASHNGDTIDEARSVNRALLVSPSNKEVRFARCMGSHPPPFVSQDVLAAAIDMFPNSVGPRLLRVSGSIIVKFGRDVALSEAETMSLVARRCPAIPIPALRNAYTVAGQTFIVMECIDGVRLSSCWEEMSSAQKDAVVDDLREYVSAWRCVKGSFFGAVDGTPCKERMFRHPYEPPEVPYGPFKCRRQYNNGLVEALRASRPAGIEHDIDLEDRIMNSSGDEMVLTHGDLHMGNILVDQHRKINGILDWGESCYSITEMEYCAARWGSRHEDWSDRISEFTPGSPEQFKFWHYVNEELRQYSGV